MSINKISVCTRITEGSFRKKTIPDFIYEVYLRKTTTKTKRKKLGKPKIYYFFHLSTPVLMTDSRCYSRGRSSYIHVVGKICYFPNNLRKLPRTARYEVFPRSVPINRCERPDCLLTFLSKRRFPSGAILLL